MLDAISPQNNVKLLLISRNRERLVDDIIITFMLKMY